MKSLLIATVLVLGLITFSFANISIAAADLPPRPTVEPTKTTHTVSDDANGSQIILQLEGFESSPTVLWTVIQWQGNNNIWYTVDGWQGSPNEDGQVIWWVASRDLGTGPFRWLVYESPDTDELLVTTAPFDLPDRTGQQTTITVELP